MFLASGMCGKLDKLTGGDGIKSSKPTLGGDGKDGGFHIEKPAKDKPTEKE